MTDREQNNAESALVAGCGFLSLEDLRAAVEGRLSSRRRREFENHIEEGCAECTTLAADIATFRQILAGGLTDSERREEEHLAEPLRTLLRREIRRRNLTSS